MRRLIGDERWERLPESERTGALELVRVISTDPLLSTRVVQAANSVAYSRIGPRVSDIRSAVVRIGSNQVKTLATAVAMAQLVTYRKMLPFKAICHRIIEHSRQVAAYAFVLTRAHSRLDADKALFAALIHDMGTLYLLFRLSERPDLFGDAAGLRTLLINWRGQIGHSVMAALEVTPEIQDAIVEGNLVVSSVLSGNRNFEGRISNFVKANFLASPPLVVAYAIAGSTRIDLRNDPIGKGSNGQDVYLKDIWPTNDEIAAVIKASVSMIRPM